LETGAFVSIRVSNEELLRQLDDGGVILLLVVGRDVRGVGIMTQLPQTVRADHWQGLSCPLMLDNMPTGELAEVAFGEYPRTRPCAISGWLVGALSLGRGGAVLTDVDM
jgi:hypothetical protein